MFRYLAFLLFPLHLFAYTDIGVVTIRFSGGEYHPVKVYQSATAATPFTICYSDNQLDSLLHSYYMYSGTTIISYCCAAETKDRYCIRKQTMPSPFYWIEKDSFTEFNTWKYWWDSWGDTYIGTSQVIHKAPNDHSATVKNTCECGIVSVDSLSGDWMQVSFSSECAYGKVNCPLEKVTVPLWIRWRNGDDIFLDPYIAE